MRSWRPTQKAELIVGPSRPVVGLLWMVATGLCFAAVTGIVKYVGQSLPAPQMVFLRYLLGLVFLVPLIPAMWQAGIAERHAGVFVMRGVPHAFASLLWYFAMTRIPMAEVTAMNYLQPVYITLGAALFLGERLAMRRLIAIAVALLGAALILRPGFRELSSGHLAMLTCAPLFAASYLLAKTLTVRVQPMVVVGWMSVVTTIGLAPFGVAVWVRPDLADLGWLLVTAGIATVAHYTMMLAFRAAPLAVTQPASFLTLIWSSAIGFMVFGERVDHLVMLGGAVIVAAISYIGWRESRSRGG